MQHGDLFGELYLAEQAERAQPRVALSAYWPGLAISGIAAAGAGWLSDHYRFPVILLGLLVGLALNFVAQDERTHPGLDLAARTCLRIGIAVLGFQITFAQVGTIGIVPFAGLVLVMAVTLGTAVLAARWMGQSPWVGVLAGGATAICGASAALALYGVIGRERVAQAQFALTLVGIALASAIAMTAYPILASALDLSASQAGFLTGAAIHDVAQAIGGGFAVSDAAGQYATIVKLARVALLAPLVALVALCLPAGGGAGGTKPAWQRLVLPWFIVAFLAAMTVNSLVALPRPLTAGALDVSKGLLLIAVTATAMRTRLDLLLETGWRAMVPIAAASLASCACALTVALLTMG